MIDLRDEVSELHELHELRNRAKELREQGRRALKDVRDVRIAVDDPVTLESGDQELQRRWISSGNNVEVALLVKVQNHQDIAEDEKENDEAKTYDELKKRLEEIKLENLFPSLDRKARVEDEEKGDRRVPVLLAARAMQALLSRSETVFSKATMVCYYRIVRELYIAARPDWTIGAARAGTGGSTSAFVTGECIRAIFAFEDVMKRTATFFQQTSRLLGRFALLDSMRSVLPNDGFESKEDLAAQVTPLDLWADRAIERMWFDWHISTNPRDRNIGLYCLGTNGNKLFFKPETPVTMNSVREYREDLEQNLSNAIRNARTRIAEAHQEIDEYRQKQYNSISDVEPRKIPPDLADEAQRLEKRARDYDRAESAHKFAHSLVGKAIAEAEAAIDCLSEDKTLEKRFEDLAAQFRRMAEDIHRVLEPAKRYIRTVLHREVAATALGRFDAGELVFAAASFGAITNWKPNEILNRACDLLVEALPETGRLPTTRPFQSTLKGHRMLPIGCEMTRSLAQLLQKTNYSVSPQIARRMLNIFEEKLIVLDSVVSGVQEKRVAWNFEGSPDPNNPCVWVTAVSVLALDRVVRMLNDRINSIVFKYFEVIKPEKPHTSLTLNDLVYSDHGLSEYYLLRQRPMALRLEQMRAHLMRVTLPDMYKDTKGKKEIVTSAIFYGPPGTGKTTLVEAVALSGEVPLIRLSPSDLVVQGPAAIEGRARAVFEALSMLTQVAIIMDEFEDVIANRGGPAPSRDGKIFDFLRTGMLPKLVKLNDASRKQSFVYCLATNHLEKIDLPAQRKGRFDMLLPVFDPDPLSRAGTFLYRLTRILKMIERAPDFRIESQNFIRRFLEVVVKTSDTRASSLADDYLRWPDWAIVVPPPDDLPDAYESDIPVFWYVLTGADKGYTEKISAALEEGERSRTDRRKARAERKNQKAPPTEEEKIADWLADYEQQLSSMLKKETELSLEDLWTCLVPRTAAKAATTS